jgi:hypothetical protein
MEWMEFPLRKAFRLSQGNKSSHFFLGIVYKGMQPSSLTLGIQYRGLWNNWNIPRITHNQHTCLCVRFEAKGNGNYVSKGDMQKDQNFVDFTHSFMQ